MSIDDMKEYACECPCPEGSLGNDQIDRLRAALAEAEKERDALRETLAPFALFASALKNLKPHYPVLQYGHQSISAASFYDAQAQFPELAALHAKSKP